MSEIRVATEDHKEPLTPTEVAVRSGTMKMIENHLFGLTEDDTARAKSLAREFVEADGLNYSRRLDKKAFPREDMDQLQRSLARSAEQAFMNGALYERSRKRASDFAEQYAPELFDAALEDAEAAGKHIETESK